MNVNVNGKQTDVADGTSIVMLLSQFNITSPMTIVEMNREVVAREEWDGRKLSEGDEIEIIQLMGGG
jgi:sulfur carrier protein